MAEEYPLKLPQPIPEVIPFTSRDLVSGSDPLLGSEFGGVDGLVQPYPHIPNEAERLHMIYAIDPTDPGTDASRGSVAPPVLEDF